MKRSNKIIYSCDRKDVKATQNKINLLFSNYTVSKSAARLHFQSRRSNPSKTAKTAEPPANAGVPKSKSTSGLHVAQNNSYIQRIQINRSIPNANNNLPKKRMFLALIPLHLVFTSQFYVTTTSDGSLTLSGSMTN